MRACPLPWIHWEKLKEIKLKFLLTFFGCVVLSPSLYMLIQLFSSISANSSFQFQKIIVNYRSSNNNNNNNSNNNDLFYHAKC